MRGYLCIKARNFDPTSTVRAAAGLGLILILPFAGAARADDVVLGFAVGMGGASVDGGSGIAVDPSGNVYITGGFRETVDFDPGAGTAYLTGAGRGDIFVSKLDFEGNFVWAKAMGGTGNNAGSGIAIDALGNVYTTGGFSETVDFDPGEGTANITSVGSAEIFVSKLDSAGNFVWAKSMGGKGFSYSGRDIAVDASGNVYTTGWFENTVDLDPGARRAKFTSAGSIDIFVLKLDTDGNFLWAKTMGERARDYGLGIAVDASGNVYTTGTYHRTVDFDPGEGTANLPRSGSGDIFVQKLDTDGNFVWARATGGVSNDVGFGIAVDASENVYITGGFQRKVDFDPGAGTANLVSIAKSDDIFVQKLDAAGNFVWAKAMGGTNGEGGGSIAVDASGNVYITGRFYGTVDFDPGAGTANLTSAGKGDIFVQMLDSSGNFVWAKAIGGARADAGGSIAVDASGNVFITGSFYGRVDFDPGAGTANLISAGESDIFVSRLVVHPD